MYLAWRASRHSFFFEGIQMSYEYFEDYWTRSISGQLEHVSRSAGGKHVLPLICIDDALRGVE